MRGRFSSQRYTSGKPGSATEGAGRHIGKFLTFHVRSQKCVRGRFCSQRYTSGKPEAAERGAKARNTGRKCRRGTGGSWGRSEGPAGRREGRPERGRREGRRGLCGVSLSSRSGCRSAVGGCGGRGVGVACSRRSFGGAFRRSRTSIRIGGLQIRGS